jgi:PilZ domain
MQIKPRRAPRYSLIVAAEVIELQTDTHIKARTSDMSLVGCYLDMMNPLPLGTDVRLQLAQQDTTFTALGTVAYTQANMGMGITFTVVEPDQQRVLEQWLAVLSTSDS